MNNIETRLEPAIYVGGKKILGLKGCILLCILPEANSINNAANILGIPYSRAWEYIYKVENSLGIKIIKSRKGRGGITLTKEGRKFILGLRSKLKPHINLETPSIQRTELKIIGSDDPLLRSLINRYKGDLKENIEYHIVGSLIGLIKTLIGDADLTAIHMTPITSECDIQPLELFGVGYQLKEVTSYYRLIGWIYRKDIDFKGFDDLVEGRYRFANRIKGSGMRMHLEKLIIDYSRNKEISPSVIRNNIPGYHIEYYSHRDALDSVRKGESDVTLGTRYEAESLNLGFKPLTWEHFKILVNVDSISKLRRLIDYIKSYVKENISSFSGYSLERVEWK